MSTPKEAYSELLRLHDLAMKEQARFTRATPGTETEGAAALAAYEADNEFVRALARLFDITAPVRT